MVPRLRTISIITSRNAFVLADQITATVQSTDHTRITSEMPVPGTAHHRIAAMTVSPIGWRWG